MSLLIHPPYELLGHTGLLFTIVIVDIVGAVTVHAADMAGVVTRLTTVARLDLANTLTPL